MKKTSFIHCRVEPEVKKKLRSKAKELNCKNLTEFFERIANETIVIVDPNVQNLLKWAFVPQSSVSVLTK